jgi:hypothetical protein
MTPTRVFIIVLVLIAVLFGIVLVCSDRSGTSSQPSITNLVSSWKATFQNLGRMNPEDIICAQRKNTTITISNGLPQIQATIRATSSDRVRRLSLELTSPGSVTLDFVPKPGDDDRAVRSKFDLQHGETKTLAVFAPGGTLTLSRATAIGPAIIEIR